MAKAANRSKTKILLSTFILLTILVSASVIVGIWRFVGPYYKVSAYLQCDSEFMDIMSAEKKAVGTQEQYQRYVATQCLAILSTSVIEEVANDLHDKELKILAPGLDEVWRNPYGPPANARHRDVNPVEVMRRLARNGILEARPVPNTEWIEVSMTSPLTDEAIVIVDSFVRKYHLLYDVGADREGQRNLMMLVQEKEAVFHRVTLAKKAILSLTKEAGLSQVQTLPEWVQERASGLAKEVSQLEMSRARLETRIAVLEEEIDSNVPVDIDPEGRKLYIDQDPLVQELAKRIAIIEPNVITARQISDSTHPVTEEQERLLGACKKLLDAKVLELGQDYDDLMADRSRRLRRSEVKAMTRELAEIREQENRWRAKLDEKELRLGQANNAILAVKDKQFELDLDMEIYDTLSRRIKQMEMEKNRRPRISIREYAGVRSYTDPRWKYSGLVVLGTIGILVLLSIIRGRLGRVRAAA